VFHFNARSLESNTAYLSTSNAVAFLKKIKFFRFSFIFVLMFVVWLTVFEGRGWQTRQRLNETTITAVYCMIPQKQCLLSMLKTFIQQGGIQLIKSDSKDII